MQKVKRFYIEKIRKATTRDQIELILKEAWQDSKHISLSDMEEIVDVATLSIEYII